MTEGALHVTELGDHGPRVAFFHGLFGQGRNWTSIGRSLSSDHRVLLVDMPNHGRSEWTERLDYPDLADRCASLFSAEDPVALIGHSMGGKIAMVLALRHPELVERLAVVDIAPVAYDATSEFARYIEAMRAIDLDVLPDRGAADRALQDAVPDPTVRGFLLQNLRRDGDRWRWQPHLDLLGDQLDVLGGWPAEELAALAPYDGPVLWIAGERSAYVRPEHQQAMARWFPRARKVTVKGAGHWVHSESPEVFRELISRFLG